MKKPIARFEVRAYGMKKNEGEEGEQPVQSIVSRHVHYSQAHDHLVRKIGAEKIGIEPNIVFKKDNLTFLIHPFEGKSTKKNKPMDKKTNKRVRIVREAISLKRLKEASDIVDPEPGLGGDKSQKISKPQKTTKDETPNSDDTIVKGNKTLTGEKPDIVNTEPKLKDLPTVKGNRVNYEPSVNLVQRTF